MVMTEQPNFDGIGPQILPSHLISDANIQVLRADMLPDLNVMCPYRLSALRTRTTGYQCQADQGDRETVPLRVSSVSRLKLVGPGDEPSEH